MELLHFPGGISNGGKIESSANNVIAMTFDSDANTGSKKFENEANGMAKPDRR